MTTTTTTTMQHILATEATEQTTQSAITEAAKTTKPAMSLSPRLPTDNDSRSTPIWIPIVVVVILSALLSLLLAFFIHKKRKSEVEEEEVSYNWKSANCEEIEDVVPSAPPQYEEIGSCRQIVDNIIYESSDIETNSDYDHLRRKIKTTGSSNYNTLNPTSMRFVE